MERVMLRTEKWARSASRAELDQRSRATRLQLEELERRHMAQARTRSWLYWLVCWLRRASGRSTARPTKTAVAAPRGVTAARGGFDLDILCALGAA